MADIVTSLTIDDSGYQAGADRVVQADKKMVASQTEVQAAADKTAKATIQVTETQRQIIPATTGSAAAFDRLRRAQDPVYDASLRIAKAERDAEAAIRAEKVTRDQAAVILDKYRTSLDRTGNASVAHTGAVKLQAYQIANLGQQIQDVGVQLASGANPFLILAQQGPQITTAMGGTRNAIKLVTEQITPFRVGMVAAAGAAALVVARSIDLGSEARQVGVALRAMGRDAQFSTEQVHGLIEALRDQGLSKADARSVQLLALRTPGASASDITRAVGLAPDFAAGFGGSAEDATKKLLDMGTQGFTAIKKLDDAYNFLSPHQLRQIRELSEQGQQAKALEIAYGALEARVKGLARDSMSPAAEALHAVKRGFDDLVESASKIELLIQPIEQLGKVLSGLARTMESGSFKQGIATLGEIPLINLGTRSIDKVFGTNLSGAISSASQKKTIPGGEFTGSVGIQANGPPSSAGASSDGDAQKIQRMTKYVDEQADAVTRANSALSANADVREIVRARLAAQDEALKNNITGAERDRLIALREGEARQKLAVAIRDQTAALKDQIAAQDEAARAFASGGLSAGLQAEARARARQERLTNPNVDVDARTQEILQEQGSTENLSLQKALEQARRQNADLAAVAGAGGQPAAIEQARRQAEANSRFATAEALGVPNVQALKEQWIETAKATADYNREIQANADNVALDNNLEMLQREYDLLGENERTRERELALLKEKQRLIAQGFEGQALQAELDKRRATVEATADLRKQIEFANEAERDFREIARQALTETISGFLDGIKQAKSFGDIVSNVEQTLIKIGEDAATRSLSRQVDAYLSGYGDLASKSSGDGPFGFISQLINGPSQAPLPGLEKVASGDIVPMRRPANDNAAEQLTAAADQLSGAGEALNQVPNTFSNLLGQQLANSVFIQCATVTVNGGVSADGGGGIGGAGGIIGSLFGTGGGAAAGAGTDTILNSGFDSAVAESTASSGVEFTSAFGYFHGGGRIGAGGDVRTMSIDPAAVRAAPRAHTGMGPDLKPDERMIVALTNERVLSPEQTRAYEAGKAASGARTGSNISAPITLNINGNVSKEALDRARRTAAQVQRDTLDRAQANQARFG